MKYSHPLCAFGLLLGILLLAPPLTKDILADDTPAKGSLFEIAGPVTVTQVIDGDSLKSGKLRIRLFGIDAPEQKQLCKQADGSIWACGRAASAAMGDIVAGAARLRCELLYTDRYGRLVMRCFAGETDIARALVAQGLAVAYRRYSEDYVDAEDRAAAAGRGMWQGPFDMPWDWRRKN